MTATAAFGRREAPGRALAENADAVARACHDMAERFRRGGKLLVFGNGAQATDAAHVAVEFVHPVVVGKRALPAVTLTGDPSALTGIARASGIGEIYAAQLRLLSSPEDIAMGLSPDGWCENVRRALATAREMGLLTIALTGGEGGDPAADHALVARSEDPRVVKEITVTTYHILWELVHVFLERTP